MEDDQNFDLSMKKKKNKKKIPSDLNSLTDENVTGKETNIPEKSKKDKSSGEFGHEDGLENGNLGDDTSNVFNFGDKKKKKKKKVRVDFDTELGDADESETRKDKENQHPVSGAEESSEFDLGESGKKKKSKKKTTFKDELEIILTDTNSNKGGENEPDSNVEGDLLDMDFSMKKKRKKKKELDELVGEEMEYKLDDVTEDAEESGRTWSGSDRDYTYDELLTRVFEIMREKNPDMVSGKKQKFIMRPPQVVRIGTKKTSFANFTEICKTLHRLPKHLLDFLLAELGTSGSVDGNSQLIIKGRFLQKQIENVLKRYIKEYVTCHTCRSPETILQKDTRLFFLQCQTCGSRCSVASIKSGFQAVTGKRAAIRAKTA